MFKFFKKHKDTIQKALRIIAYVAVIIVEAVKAVISYMDEQNGGSASTNQA